MALEGYLHEFSVPDLIQLVDLSKKTGMTHIQSQQGGEPVEGFLYFRDGRITGATLDEMEPLEAALTFFYLTRRSVSLLRSGRSSSNHHRFQ